MNFNTHILKLKTKTWGRDSYSLFDYEMNNCFNHTFEIQKPGYIMRDANEIVFLDEKSYNYKKKLENISNLEQLAFVTEQDGGIVVKSDLAANANDINKKLWYIIKENDSTSKGYLLKTNDIIKLGRVIFKIKQIKLQEDQAQGGGGNHNYNKTIVDSIKEHFTQVKPNAGRNDIEAWRNNDEARASVSSICRICLSGNSEDDDPLISPCACSGSMQFVHLKCLQRWVKSKLNILENKNLITVYWKNLNCELCKTALPFNFQKEGKEYCIVPLDTDKIRSYVMMESLSKDKEPTGIHIIDISGTNRILLGRGHDCDLKISDISVSRIHAFMKISKGKVYLEDNSSKFGTLLLKKSDVVFSESANSASLQSGRTVMKFIVKRPWLSFIPCIGTRSNYVGQGPVSRIPSRKETRIEEDYDDEFDDDKDDEEENGGSDKINKYLLNKEKKQ